MLDQLPSRIEESIETDDTSIHQAFFQASKGQPHTSSNTSQPSSFLKHAAHIMNGQPETECIFETSTSDKNSFQANMQTMKINDFDPKSTMN